MNSFVFFHKCESYFLNSSLTEFTIIKCGLSCRTATHFHCCYCAATLLNRMQLVMPCLHLPDSGPRWCPMAKSAAIVITSANSVVASGNTVTLPGNIVRQREETGRNAQWSGNNGQHRQRTNMFVNFGSIGVESVTRCCYGLIGYNRE